MDVTLGTHPSLMYLKQKYFFGVFSALTLLTLSLTILTGNKPNVGKNKRFLTSQAHQAMSPIILQPGGDSRRWKF